MPTKQTVSFRSSFFNQAHQTRVSQFIKKILHLMFGLNSFFFKIYIYFAFLYQLQSPYHRSESARCSAAVVSVHVETALHRRCWGPEQAAADGAKRDTPASRPCHGYWSHLFGSVKLLLIVLMRYILCFS